MATIGLTVTQKHWLLYMHRRHPAACCKVPKVVQNALIRRGYAEQVTVPLSNKQHIKLNQRGVRYAQTGEQ